MKYKNIKSAIHNFGYSFVSDENYVDEEYVSNELAAIHNQGFEIVIDWLNRTFEPKAMCSPRIEKSIGYWADGLNQLLKSQNVDIQKLKSLEFVWPIDSSHFMVAIDDFNVEHKKVVRYFG